MSIRWLVVCSIPTALLFLGCQESSAPQVKAEVESAWFADVTDEVGLNFVHDCGPTGTYFMPQLTGGGAALLDFNNDGRLDIYLVQNGGPESGSTNRLFRQELDGRFVDASAGSGLDTSGYGQGVAVGDVNNDGWPEVVITEYGRTRLFLNRGNGTFSEWTEQAGLDNPLWAISAAFVDYDRDGLLDLIVVNYIEYVPNRPCSGSGGQRDFCGPSAFAGTVTRLYHNLGPLNEGNTSSVHFRDVTVESGLASMPGPGLGIASADFDGDGWPDLFVTNDGAPNRLWMNQKDGTFVEEGVLRGVAYNGMGQAEANMGVALGDVDADGFFDVFVTHLHEESHRLWKQFPRGYFQDQTAFTGLTTAAGHSTGFGTLLADFDHDGAVDLVLVNGLVKRAGNDPPAKDSSDFWAPYRQANILYANDAQGRFHNRSNYERSLCGVPGAWRAVVSGDINGDGALDLLVTRLDGTARLLKNVAPNRGHWLMIRAWDPTLKRDAYGSEITLVAGDQRWTRWVNPCYSYGSSNDPRAHFGLGQIDRVDEIRIQWPDGLRERFTEQAANQIITIRKGEGTVIRTTPE